MSVCAFKSGVIIVLIVTVVLAARAVFACGKALFREELVGRAQVRVTPHGVYYSKTPVQQQVVRKSLQTAATTRNRAWWP